MAVWRVRHWMCMVLVTAFLVFMLPVDQLSSCHCANNVEYERTERDKLYQALGKKDLIVYGESEMNETINKIHQFKDGKLNAVPDENSRLIEFKQDGWVLDCVTWERKLESRVLDAEPHDFLMDVYHLGHGEDHKDRKKTFQMIFNKKDWPANDPSYYGLQSSGPGAMLKNAQGILATLHVVITKIKQKLGKSQITMLDLPCGDMQWMSKFLLTRNDIIYTGADIVPEIINHHRKEFDRLPRTKFIEWDIVKTPFNESYDLILSRDLLQHLWQVDAVRALDHISSSKSHFLLVTTYPDNTQNTDVEKDALGGRKSPYNLELPPFLLEPPICMSYDWNVEHLGLWSLPLRQKFEY